MLVRPKNLPHAEKRFSAILYWMGQESMEVGTEYAIRHAAQEAKALISKIHYKMDLNTLHRDDASNFAYML